MIIMENFDEYEDSDFEFNQEDRVPSKNLFARISGLGFLALILVLGTTFAANININSGANVEFGQGISATAACTNSSTITIKPASSFVNASGAGSMKFASLVVSGVPTTCQGAVFHFSAFNDTGTAALALFNTTNTDAAVFMKSDNTFVAIPGTTGISVSTLTSSSFSITFTTPVSDSKSVYKISVESTKGNCEQGISCSIGAKGPGGGVVFLTPASSGNTTGKYYEIAPADAVGTYALCGIQIVNGLGLNNAIGYGETNTISLNSNSNCNSSSNAAYVATHYTNNGYSDWFLPSYLELVAAKSNVLSNLTNVSASYLSSSENSGNSVWWVDFDASVSCGGGNWPGCTTYKNDASVPLRAVRTFSGLN